MKLYFSKVFCLLQACLPQKVVKDTIHYTTCLLHILLFSYMVFYLLHGQQLNCIILNPAKLLISIAAKKNINIDH